MTAVRDPRPRSPFDFAVPDLRVARRTLPRHVHKATHCAAGKTIRNHPIGRSNICIYFFAFHGLNALSSPFIGSASDGKCRVITGIIEFCSTQSIPSLVYTSAR